MYIVTVEPAVGASNDTEAYSDPKWKFVEQGESQQTFVLMLGKRIERMDRADMTRLLLWIPELKQQLWDDGFSERFIEIAARHVRDVRRQVSVRLALKRAHIMWID